MAADPQLEWEARTGRVAGYAAFVSVLLVLGAQIYIGVSLRNRGDGLAGFLVAVEDHPREVIGSALLESMGFMLLALVLGYLFKATKHRRPRTPAVALVLAAVAPLAVGALVLVSQIELVTASRDFVAAETKAAPPTGTLLRTRPKAKEKSKSKVSTGANSKPSTKAKSKAPGKAPDLEERAKRSARAGNLTWLNDSLYGAKVGLGIGLMLIALNAMKAGLLSRFMGILGAIVGGLYILPPGLGGPLVIQLFWLPALGLLFAGRWPGGRGPAWEAGEAIPWPSAAEQRAKREGQTGAMAAATEENAPGRRPGGSDPAGAAADEAIAQPRKRKRKR